MDIFRRKHPEPKMPAPSSFLHCDPLPSLTDLDVTGAYIHIATVRIQGSGGPGSCDVNHWQDVLLCYGAHSEKQRHSVDSLVRRLANTIVPWRDIRALVYKYPGVRPIGVRETF